MRIINTQKKWCNRALANQADLPLFYDAFKNNFQQLNKPLKIKTQSLAKDGTFSIPGKGIFGVFETFLGRQRGDFIFFQYAISIFTDLADKWTSSLNYPGSKPIFTPKHLQSSCAQPGARFSARPWNLTGAAGCVPEVCTKKRVKPLKLFKNTENPWAVSRLYLGKPPLLKMGFLIASFCD